MVQAIDLTMLLTIYGGSAYLAYRYALRGLLAGVILVWFGGILSMEVLILLDPDYSPGVLGAAKFLFGGVVGLLWCAPFYAINIAVKKLIKRKAKRHA
ncbi:hypothetical protein [Microbulbifer sp. JMSA003]|uniref:hypothetical protein n=1 Tax=Microbulbifer sp. JMSA003 TaxID=3243369 RepID=UPI00403A53CF